MATRSWIRKLFAHKPCTIRKDPVRFRLCVEALEDRTLLTNPATPGDLVAAIISANSSGTPTTITLAASTTFNFTSADNGANALPVITGNITIVGNGDTIQRTGAMAFRFFDVASGGSLTLEDLTLMGGLAQGTGAAAEGGAVYSLGALALSGVTVKSNKAQGSNGANATNAGATGGNGASAYGGGLYVAGGTVTLNNDTLSGNIVQGGTGGTGGKGTPGANGFSPDGGPGGTGGDGLGGAMYVAAGTVTLSNATLSGNFANGGTGGKGGKGGSAFAGV
jgi:hypothetical protein